MDADEYQGMQIPRGATIISNVWYEYASAAARSLR